jgi:hypothetical protein
MTAAVAVNGWIIGTILRLASLAWKHDGRVRAEIEDLERAAWGEAGTGNGIDNGVPAPLGQAPDGEVVHES